MYSNKFLDELFKNFKILFTSDTIPLVNQTSGSQINLPIFIKLIAAHFDKRRISGVNSVIRLNKMVHIFSIGLLMITKDFSSLKIHISSLKSISVMEVYN
jgi:hypothetical protein